MKVYFNKMEHLVKIERFIVKIALMLIGALALVYGGPLSTVLSVICLGWVVDDITPAVCRKIGWEE